MNATIDPDLVKAVQQDLIALKNGVDKFASKVNDDEQKLQRALQDAVTAFEELARRVSQIEEDQQVMKQSQYSLTAEFKSAQDKLSQLQTEKEEMERRVTNLEYQKSSSDTKISYGNKNFFFTSAHARNSYSLDETSRLLAKADARSWLNFKLISLLNAVLIFLVLRANLEADIME